MHDATEDSVHLWREVASAVEYIAAMERPGFTVWDALADAIAEWIADEDRAGPAAVGECLGDGDRLRAGLAVLDERWLLPGTPGGGPISTPLAAAIGGWLQRSAFRANLGHRFANRLPQVQTSPASGPQRDGSDPVWR